MTAKKNNPAAALARFKLAPENARATVEHDAEGLAALAGSIRAFGRLLEPLKVYEDAGSLMVWDGGRRLAALQLLAQDETPPALLDAIAYDLTTREEAGLASMATFIRQPMHVADRFFAYSALFEAGQTAEQIGAACGVSAKGVAQLLRFRCLAPEVVEAFRAGRMDFDACLAFTLSTDHDKQREVLASFGDRQPLDYVVRRAFKTEGVYSSDYRAVMVGRDAYEAAGGRFISDLFSDSDEVWQDAPILVGLYEEKIDALVGEVQAEGWGDVVVSSEPWNWRVGLDQVEPEAEGEELTAEQKAEALAVVVINPHGGTVEVKRGFKVRAKASGGSAQGETAKAKPAVTDPARWGWGHGGHEATTVAATMAVRRALMANPAAAYDAMTAHLAWEALGWGNEAVSGLRVRGGAAQVEEADARLAWRDRLPVGDRQDFYQAVADLSADDKAALLAFCFALTVSVREARTDAHDVGRWAQLGWVARLAGVRDDEAFAPAETFFKLGSRAALLTAVEDLAPGEAATKAEAKKGVLVAYVTDKAKASGWLPRLIRDLLAAPEAAQDEKPAKGARKGRRKGSATDDAANDAEAAADAA